jgi:hypothetical protein
LYHAFSPAEGVKNLWDCVLGIKLLSYRQLEMVGKVSIKKCNSQMVNCQLLMGNETLMVTKFRVCSVGYHVIGGEEEKEDCGRRYFSKYLAA